MNAYGIRREVDNLQAELDMCKAALAHLIDARKDLDPDPEFDAIFAQQRAEVEYKIASIEKQINLLNFQIDMLEFNNTL